MRFSRDWIAAHVEVPDDDALTEVLSMLGLVVDGAQPRGADTIFDLDIASNRPDLMNHLAVAAEIALARGSELHDVDLSRTGDGPDTAAVAAVEIVDRRGCPRFVACALLDVEVGPSPAWLVERLESIGLRPINNVVDITNFVMWERGRPMHAYDLDRLAGPKLVVRRARQGERLVTLDDVERRLSDTDLVIADAERPVGLAGVMGGADTGVTESTRRVLLECACFDPGVVRATARHHGLHTDASHRFERGLSAAGLMAATARAAALVEELARGKVSRAVIDARGVELERPRILLHPDRVRALLGIDIEPDDLEARLRAMGFEVGREAGCLDLQVPAQRTDMRLPEDVVEEIARFWGYDRLPATLPVLRRANSTGLAPALRRERRLRETVVGLGFWEAMTFAFTSEAEQSPMLRERELLPLVNPLSEAFAVLRASMLPGLIGALGRNLDRGADRVRLFELGRNFAGADGAVDERRNLALVACGTAHPARYGEVPRPFDFADLRGIVDTLARRMRWPVPLWWEAEIAGLQPGAAAALRIGDGAGRGGRVDANILAPLGIQTPVWALEVDVEALLESRPASSPLRPTPRFPASSRDLSLLVPPGVAYAAIVDAVSQAGGDILESLGLVDVYRGDDLPDGVNSMTIRLTFRALDRTLTAEEVEAASTAVSERLAADLDVRRR